MYDKYDIIYSLGAGCGCTMLMDYEGLRTFAGPFDWVRTDKRGLDQAFALMMNDFADFFNYEDFKVRTDPKPVDPLCHAYENIKTSYIFFHDFPKEKPMEESFAAVKKKYERRIERFYRLISERKRVLLVWYSFTNNTSDEDVVRLCGEFCRKMNKTIDFLIIEHTEGLYQPLKRQIADNIARYNFHALAKDPEAKDYFMGNSDLTRSILRQYKLHIPWTISLKYDLAKPLIRLMSAFIVKKEARKRFRDKMFKKLRIPEGKR